MIPIIGQQSAPDDRVIMMVFVPSPSGKDMIYSSVVVPMPLLSEGPITAAKAAMMQKFDQDLRAAVSSVLGAYTSQQG